MHWNSVNEFFFMGGYALYVWGSFGLTALALVVEVLSLRGRSRAIARGESPAPLNSGAIRHETQS